MQLVDEDRLSRWSIAGFVGVKSPSQFQRNRGKPRRDLGYCEKIQLGLNLVNNHARIPP
ncbi:hypothetical protein [Streptomyces sp. NPDC013489]|uniref:hypothetical protein n=1 Tax=Streptomyces sp. NPDC013489 TaxID=3155606 RepID=UPI0033F4E593